MGEIFQFRSQLERIKLLIDHTPIAYIILDRDYRIHYINKSFAKLRKLDINQTIGDKCYNISNGGRQCEKCAVAGAIRTGIKTFLRRKDILADGTVRFLDDYAFPLQKNSAGEVEYILEMMIDRTEEMTARERRRDDYGKILAVLSSLLDAKDHYTAEHSEHVRMLAMNLAQEMGLPSEEVFEISVAASLHDIGKIRVPEAIINKRGKLTPEEFDVIRQHPAAACQMLEGLTSFSEIGRITMHHHERVDGTGYPDGLKGEQIPVGARIIGVADTYDAITTNRSYRKAQSREAAFEELRRVAGTQLDAELVARFLGMDFDNLSDTPYEHAGKKKMERVERVLFSREADGQAQEESGGVKSEIDLNHLMHEIFRHTPCGYILMDKEQKVLYASDYYLAYMGIKKEDAIGAVCHKTGAIADGLCEGCPIILALSSKTIECARREADAKSGHKIFDMYGVPLCAEGEDAEYVVGIIIDREKEVQMERQREQDFGRLIDLLEKLLESQKEQIGERKLEEKIRQVRNKLNLLQQTKED